MSAADPQTVRDDDTFCPHTTYPLQVTLSLLESDLTVRHVDCGRVVMTDWPYLRANEVPLELSYARDDADEDWLELRARPAEQPQDERDDAVKLVRRAPCDRISYIADQLEASITDLRGLPGVSRARVVLAASVTSLRELADVVLGLEVEQDERDGDVRPERAQRKPVDIGTGMPATTHLESFGQCLRDAFGAMPYHVGSSIHGKAWRDVDVRIMLDDDRFDALFPGYAGYRQRDAWWALVCSAISELGKQRTGLPIDFQVQRTTEANEKFPGARNPLFVGHAKEEHRPAMLVDAAPRQPERGGEVAE